MVTIGDGLCLIGIALILLALFSPVIVMELKDDPIKTEYEICINACDRDIWSSDYVNPSCPKQCQELLNCKQLVFQETSE